MDGSHAIYRTVFFSYYSRMNQHEIAIATMTWARTAQEREVLCASLASLATLSMDTFITDGGSDPDFSTYLQGFPQFQVFEVHPAGVWRQMHRSLHAAGETKASFVLYTEPDKCEFFRNILPRFIAQAPRQDDVGIILASRSAASFETFPAFQQYTETAINRCCAEFTGMEGDYTYGPFLLHRNLIPYLKYVSEEMGWGWRPFLFALAHRLGYRVEFLLENLPCPQEQREDNPAERKLRMRQLSQSIQGLLLANTISLESL